jgi:hypothetical protein
MNVGSIHQIEITSRCNLRCKYCVHPTMARGKADMGAEVWRAALAWVRLFCKHGTQGPELNLCGIGESTLHPRFGEMVLEAREAVGITRALVLATNGVGVTEDHAYALRLARVHTWVSLHRPEKAGPAVNLLRRYGVLAGVSVDPAMSGVDWAGQVKWEVTAPRSVCPWLSTGKVMIAADGSVLTCSFDGDGRGRLGDVFGDVAGLESAAYSLCVGCHQEVPR